MKFQRVLSLVAVCAGVCTALPAAAQFAKPEDAVKYRKAAFTVMAAHFGRLAPWCKAASPMTPQRFRPTLTWW